MSFKDDWKAQAERHAQAKARKAAGISSWDYAKAQVEARQAGLPPPPVVPPTSPSPLPAGPRARKKMGAGKVVLVVVLAVVLLAVVAAMVGSKDKAKAPSAYDHTITNNANENVFIIVERDGHPFCKGELGTGFTESMMHCQAAGYDGASHRYLVEAQYPDGSVKDTTINSTKASLGILVGKFEITYYENDQ